MSNSTTTNTAIKLWLKILPVVVLLLIAAASTVILSYVLNSDATGDEISEEDQIELFMYTETHPHLRLAYTRANSDGVITEDERDAIMDRIIEAMKRGTPSSN